MAIKPHNLTFKLIKCQNNYKNQAFYLKKFYKCKNIC